MNADGDADVDVDVDVETWMRMRMRCGDVHWTAPWTKTIPP